MAIVELIKTAHKVAADRSEPVTDDILRGMVKLIARFSGINSVHVGELAQELMADLCETRGEVGL